MRKLAVVGDTHLPRFRARFPVLVARLRAEAPAAIQHCGDHCTLEAETALAAIAPFHAVAGNNDGPDLHARYGERRIVTFPEGALGLVHGDGPRGTTRNRALAAFADVAELDAICFGHSHQPICERVAGRWLVNPGSGTDKRREAAFSYAVVDLAGEATTARLVYFAG